MLRQSWARLWRGELEGVIEALDGATAPEERALRARTLLLVGRTRESIALCEGTDEPALVGIAGVAYRLCGAPAEAVDRCNDALRPTPHDPQRLIDAGLAYVAMGDHDTAHALLAEAVDRSTGDRRTAAVIAQSAAALARGDSTGASALASHAARSARRSRARHLEACALTHLADALTAAHDYRAARKLHRLAADLHRAHGHLAGVAAALGGLGLCAMGGGMVSEGVREFNRAITLCRQLEHRERESWWRGALDRGLVLLQRPEERIDALRQWLGLVRELHDRAGEAAILCDLGNCYVEIRDPESAAGWYRQALETSIANDNAHAATIDRLNLGLTLAKLPASQDAIPYLEDGLATELAPEALSAQARAVLEELRRGPTPLPPPSTA